MPVRTTPAQVRLINTEINPLVDLAPFIEMASGLVDELCTGDAGPTPPYDVGRLELIERWLAAHFHTNMDPRLEQEKTGEASGKYRGKTDLGLLSSLYGQTAVQLDTNGGLARNNRANTRPASRGDGLKTELLWLGTELST